MHFSGVTVFLLPLMAAAAGLEPPASVPAVTSAPPAECVASECEAEVATILQEQEMSLFQLTPATMLHTDLSQSSRPMTSLDGPNSKACASNSDSPVLKPACVRNYSEFVEGFVTRMQARILHDQALDFVLNKIVTPGMVGRDKLWMEFGVYTGGSAGRIRDRLSAFKAGGVEGGMLFGFDSFQGLPEVWDKGYTGYDGYAAGSFNYTKEPFQDPHVTWVKGWFNESMPPFLLERKGGVVFAHLDADLYSSTSTVLQNLAPRIRPGCVLVFDDILNFPGYRDGELKALWELFQQIGRPLEVIGATGPAVSFIANFTPQEQHDAESAAVRLL